MDFEAWFANIIKEYSSIYTLHSWHLKKIAKAAWDAALENRKLELNYPNKFDDYDDL
jgi:hypothetical protein